MTTRRGRPGAFRAPLLALYAELDAEVARLAPVCQLSGRCCRFEEYGHTLFLSAPEAALLLAEAPPPSRPLDDGATCPWQDAAGPLHGPRGPAARLPRLLLRPGLSSPWPPSSSEAFLGRLKRLVDGPGPALELCPAPPPPATRRGRGPVPDAPADGRPAAATAATGRPGRRVGF